MIIGRKYEQKRLMDAYNSLSSEFVAVYGRRRVGKTFLVRETFSHHFTFQHSGVSKGTRSKQLQAWINSLKEYGLPVSVTPKNWMEAFEMLKELVNRSVDKRKVIFIDELPWMDTRSSGLIPALEHFWNSWASNRSDVLLIVCGSATSWIVNKILKNRGGLHNRVDYKISLKPFTLKECEQYAIFRRLGLTRKQIVEGYMVMGGVPFYWKALQRELSMAQNIDFCFFSEEGELYDEFDALYQSLFKQPEKYIRVVELLATRRYGYNRNELIKNGHFPDSGDFGKVLRDLENCGFIRSYNVIGKRKKNTIYQLIDPFTIFYYNYIVKNNTHDRQFWSHTLNTPSYYNWCGLSFERVCLQHIEQIKQARGISAVISGVYAWKSEKLKSGVQIDLVIDRNDDVIDLCEMKYKSVPMSLTEDDDMDRVRRIEVFTEETATKKAVLSVLIAANGVVRNNFSDEYQKILTLDDLFQ